VGADDDGARRSPACWRTQQRPPPVGAGLCCSLCSNQPLDLSSR
jgi:hypothetical protein